MTTKVLQLAIDRAAALPEAAEEKIGHEMLERIESLERLRADIDAGIAELDAGRGRPLHIEAVIRQARAENGAVQAAL